MRLILRIVFSVAALSIAAGLGSSPVMAAKKKACHIECVERDNNGRCILTESVCPPTGSCNTNNGGVVGCPGSTKKCYQCIRWYPNGDCMASKIVACD